MGFSLIFLSIGCLIAQPAFSDIRISGNYQGETLQEVIKDIELEADIHFSYSSKRIPADAKISLHFENESLLKVLDHLFDGLPVRYEFVDEYIILKKGKIHRTTDPEDLSVKFSFHGYVKDSRTGESLIGATIYIPETETGTIANEYGYFSLTLRPANYLVQLTYLGYKDTSFNVELMSNMKFDVALMPRLNLMEEVIIESSDKEELTFKRVASQSEVLPEQIKKMPALFGESDVLKNLELQPGINYYGDASSYFNVRGGHYDQNLILLDEATLYNPSHMLGLFSPIIPDAVKSVDIYKSGFPAEYGGRLSSVIDIRTRDGNQNRFAGSGSISPVSGRLALEGPLAKGKSSYFIAYRRSYFDNFLKPLAPNLENLYFYDFTTKFNLRLSARDRLFITLYRGLDMFRLREENNIAGLNWNNNSTTIRWNHIAGSKTFVNLTIFGSLYDYYLHNSEENGSYWNSKINNLSFKEEITYLPSPRFKLKFGTKMAIYEFNPGNYSTAGDRGMIQVSPAKSLEAVIFADIEQEIFPWLAAHYGFRCVGWRNYGEAFVPHFDENRELLRMDYIEPNEPYYGFTGLEPRLSISARVKADTYLKFSYSRTEQFINLINNSVSPFSSFEVWLPSGPNLDPQQADIFDLGFIRNYPEKGWSLQTSIFWKELRNQIAYENHASMIMNPLLEGELYQGDGYAYGFEISTQKESEKLNAQLAYTFLRSYMQVDELNSGDIFPTRQDRPHTLNLSLSYNPKPRWLITGSVNFASGARITTPTSFYYYRGYQLPAYSSINNDRLPPYTRIDMATTLQLNKTPGKYNHSLTFAVYNLFADQNPIFLYYNKIPTDNRRLEVPADRLNPEPLTPSIRYTFIVMPSISYQFNF